MKNKSEGERDTSLALWLDQHCTFPNTMVDCIVPATGSGEIEAVQEIGIDDAAPVIHERYRHWVIEDKFCAGRPDWDQVGAIFSNDVMAHENIKLRVLNAGHQILANAAELLGIDVISSCMADDDIREYFHKVQQLEVLPTISEDIGTPLSEYLQLVERRFANVGIKDTVRRVAFDGSSRHRKFVIPILRDALREKTTFSGLSLAEALWATMCRGLREDGTEIEPNDPHWDELLSAAVKAKKDPKAWLQQVVIYGDLSNSQEFIDEFCYWHSHIHEHGCRATLRKYIEN